MIKFAPRVGEKLTTETHSEVPVLRRMEGA
jgi:hypothetical protein